MKAPILMVILTGLVCVLWFVFLLPAFMRADSPRYEANWFSVKLFGTVAFLPLLIFLIYLFKKWYLFGVIPPIVLVVLAFLAGAAYVTVTDIFGEARDLMRGVKWQGLSVSDNKVYYKRRLVPGADAATAVSIGEKNWSYWKDKNKVYIETKEVSGADAATARVAGDYYLLDTSKVFYWDFTNVLQLPLDPNSFELIGEDYAKDAKSVFYRGKSIDGAHAPTFHIVGITDKKDPNYNANKIWAADKNRVYDNWGRVLEGADVNTYQRPFSDAKYAQEFSKDATHVFFRHIPVPGADANTFELLEFSGYAKDSKSVYYYGWSDAEYDDAGRPKTDIPREIAFVVEGADPATFQIQYDKDGKFDAQDRNGFYKKGYKVP
ncbi:MAG: DKNYY domain-containing protein [Chitinophagaceae bacterium]|nr:DKNYY domain-containing protein [Chitinophagaceae bacterium]